MFLDRYRVETELGKGGMGVVYRAYDQLLKRNVAIKLLTESSLGSEGRTKLLHEAQAAASLNHPNIISIYDAGEVENTGYIVMELIEGNSLYTSRPGDLKEILDITRQICLALEHAHEHNVIHRDLKPENVIVSKEGIAKLTDFGLARSVTSRLSLEGAIVGTIYYLPPEQALGKDVDGRTDLYALGVILYELLTERLPFTADDPLSVISQHLHAPVVPPTAYNPEIPQTLERLILDMLAKQPKDRPRSAANVRDVIDSLLDEGGRPGSSTFYSAIDALARGRLVGREEELDRSRRLWYQIIDNDTERNVLLISGEPGVGKTPLVREITAYAEVSRAYAFTGECYPGENAPYDPIAQIVRRAIPTMRQEEPVPALAGNQSTIVREIPSTGALPGFVVSSLLTIAPDLIVHFPDTIPNPPLEPRAEQQRLFESVAMLFERMGSSNPILLAIEDVQWADNGTLALLRYLVRRARRMNLALLILMTYREEDVSQNHPLVDLLLDLNRERLVVPVKLNRFDRKQTGQYLLTIFQEDVSDEFLDVIYSETKGNMFFIEEVCKALIEEEALYRENGRWHWPEDMSVIKIPENIRLTIQSRLNRLSSNTQDVLRLAAMIGREFDYSILIKSCDADSETIIHALEELERAQLIEEVPDTNGETFAFTHGLTMTTLREGVSGLRRRRIHEQIAQAAAELRPNDYAFLAYHYHNAGDHDLAQSYYRQAGDNAANVYANHDAIRYYTQALELIPPDHPDRFKLLSSRAYVYDIMAERDLQHEDVKRMLEIAEMRNDEALYCDALIALADYYSVTDLLQTRDPAEKAVELAEKIGDPIREGLALRRLGEDARNRKEMTLSKQALETSVERFRDSGKLDEAAISLHVLSITLGDLGEIESALSAALEALEISRKAGNRLHEATSLRRVAIVHMHANKYTEALPFAEQALELHRQLGDRAEECHALNVLGLITSWTGTIEESETYFRKSISLSVHIGANQSFLFATENLIWNYYWRSARIQEGLEYLDLQLTMGFVDNNEFLKNSLTAIKLDLLVLLGLYEEMLAIANRLLDYIQSTFSQTIYAKHLALLGTVHAEMGKFDQAEAELNQANDLIRAEGTHTERSVLAARRALLAVLREDRESIERSLAENLIAAEGHKAGFSLFDYSNNLLAIAEIKLALDQAEEALKYSTEITEIQEDSPFVREDYMYTHSKVLRANGQGNLANQYLDRAYQRVMKIAGNLTDQTLRRSYLENVRTNREIISDWGKFVVGPDIHQP